MRWFRKQYYILPEIQRPLIIQIAVILTLLSIFQALGVHLAMKWMASRVAADISLVVDYRVLGEWKKFLYLSIFIPALINIIVGVVIALYVSNKFAGPLFRLQREMNRYLSGEVKKMELNFRTDDYLHSLANTINKISDKISSIEEKKK